MTTLSRAEGDQHIEVDGHRIHCRWVRPELDGNPLVFLHEGLGSVELWRDFPERVVELTGKPGFVYSRYGNGWSDPLEEPRTAAYMHDEALTTLPALVAGLGDHPPVLVGHSDGASIAIIYAGAGHEVGGLALIAPHVFVEPETIASIAAIDASFEESGMAQRMAKYHTSPNVTFKGWSDIWLSPVFREWNIESYVDGINAPVLLIQGDADEYGTLAQLDAIEARARGPVERLLVRGAGHAPHLSHPDLVVDEVAGFIRRLGEEDT